MVKILISITTGWVLAHYYIERLIQAKHGMLRWHPFNCQTQKALG